MKTILPNNMNGLLYTSFSNPFVFKELQTNYLLVYTLAAVGNNLQGPYRYALLHSYNLQRSTIESIYLCAHLSTLCLGTVISSLSDTFGRRFACILSSLFYVIHCLSLNFNILSILIIGSIFRGMAHSLYNTNFEAWILQEHHKHGLDTESLKHLLRNAFVCATLAAVTSGIIAQFTAESLGYAAPFDIAIGVYIVMILFTLWMWTENYGDREAKPMTSFITAFNILRDEPRVVLVGLITGLFEATIYIYSIEWTPALEAAKVWAISDPLPLGFMFSGFMTFNMMGAFAFKELSKRYDVHSYMLVIIMLGVVAVSMTAMFSNVQSLVLFGIFLFEFCVGVYEPSISLLRSQYLPDSVRATLMNYFRIPRFVFMFSIIIWHFSLSIIFMFCVLMLVLSGVCLIILRSMREREEETDQRERMVLLSTSPSVGIKLKLPQMRGLWNGIDHRSVSINILNEQ
ncbi:hypothetical protein I4U23_003291 [Adineta vaga]|nr:hypothetical protein I4U23_003291 [Adineta vaga]